MSAATTEEFAQELIVADGPVELSVIATDGSTRFAQDALAGARARSATERVTEVGLVTDSVTFVAHGSRLYLIYVDPGSSDLAVGSLEPVEVGQLRDDLGLVDRAAVWDEWLAATPLPDGHGFESLRAGITAAEVDERMGLITPSLDMDDLADVDLVIEAVFERMDVKKDIFAKLDAICKPGAVLATNTSALDIDEIATATNRPESVVGMHFFSPANVMRLVEVVRADKTSIPVIHTAMTISKQIGKIASLVRVCPGFVGNRILAARRREAEALVNQGVMPWQIDKAIFDFGFAMGPYQMSDLAGLDLGWVKEESNGATVRDRLCELDRRGQKTGAGYYDYDENRTPSPSPVTEEIIREFAARSGAEPRDVTDDEIVERLTLAMANEGARILEEGMAIRASDIDIIWIYGYNWPRYRGGPMFWADQMGPAAMLARLQELEAAEGPQWKPAGLLEQLVADGKTFASIG